MQMCEFRTHKIVCSNVGISLRVLLFFCHCQKVDQAHTSEIVFRKNSLFSQTWLRRNARWRTVIEKNTDGRSYVTSIHCDLINFVP